VKDFQAAMSAGVLPPVGGVVLKVVAPCNLNCSYCYVYSGHDQTWRHRPPLMDEAMARQVVARLARHCDARPGHRIEICLHGGEPLMLGPRRFRRVVEVIREGMGERLAALNLQTNAVLVDRQWAELLSELKVAVGVSLDGPAAIHDAARVDHRGRGSHARAVAGIRRLQEAGIDVSALCVVQPGASGEAVYRFLRSLDILHIDFLLPDVSHDDWQRLFGHLPPTPAADYLIGAAEAWLAEDDPAVFIRLLSDIFGLVLGGSSRTDAFGGGPMPYLVIETDGGIHANDALRSGAEGLDASGLNVLHNDLDDLCRGPRLVRDLFAGAIPKPDACRSCREFKLCGGGYMPHRYSRDRGFNNPSVWCADILKLFAYARAKLAAHEPAAAA
jgi:uncharacterized protein